MYGAVSEITCTFSATCQRQWMGVAVTVGCSDREHEHELDEMNHVTWVSRVASLAVYDDRIWTGYDRINCCNTALLVSGNGTVSLQADLYFPVREIGASYN